MSYAQVRINNSKQPSDSLMLQYLGAGNHALDAVEVRSVRLTALGIIDSVLLHASGNYYQSPAFRCKLDISLYSVTDTLFNCTIDAYLSRRLEKMKMYLLVVPERNAYAIHVDKLDRNQSFRLMEVSGPPQTLISDYFADLRKQMLQNEVYYIRQAIDGDSAFVIITKYKAPSSIFAKRDNSPLFPNACAFRIITINRKDWAMTNGYAAIIETSEKEYYAFNEAKNYQQLSDAVSKMLSDKYRKHFSSIIKYRRDSRGYKIEDMLLENNLYLASRRPLKRVSNAEGSVYSYWMHDFVSQDTVPANWKFFSIKEMLR